MNLSRIAFITVAVASVAIASRVWAEPGADPDLPQPLDPNAAAPLISKPPFTRPLNLSEKLQLTGLAFVQGKPVATLVDRETKQNYLVSEEPNALGWKLSGATASTALKAASVQLQVGSETVTIHYGDSQLTPTGRSGRGGPSVWPSEQEVMRIGEDGKQYVRSSAYLSDADRERYYRSWSRDSHEKYRGILMEQRETMLKASPQQRADIAKKVFDQVDAEERARGGSGGDSGRPSFGGSPYRGGGPPGGDSGRPSFGNPPFRGGDSNSSGGGPR